MRDLFLEAECYYEQTSDYDQVVEACRARPRRALGVRTEDDAKDEHPNLERSIDHGSKPATLRGLYRYLPTYIRIAFGDAWFSRETRGYRRKPLSNMPRAKMVSEYSVKGTNYWLVPDAPTPKYIEDPNDNDTDNKD